MARDAFVAEGVDIRFTSSPHPDKTALLAAVRAVRIEYDQLPGVFTIEESDHSIFECTEERLGLR